MNYNPNWLSTAKGGIGIGNRFKMVLPRLQDLDRVYSERKPTRMIFDSLFQILPKKFEKSAVTRFKN